MARALHDADIVVPDFRLELRQLPSQQVEHQSVMPRPVRPALVGTHDAHGAEANPTIGSNGALVGRCRIDRQAVVSTHFEEIAGEGAEGIGTKALASVRRVDE